MIDFDKIETESLKLNEAAYAIETGTEAHAEEISAIIEHAWLGTGIADQGKTQLLGDLLSKHSPASIADDIGMRGHCYLLVRENSRMVAFASYSVRKHKKTDYHIHRIYELPCVRSKGYQKILICCIERKARAKAIDNLRIDISGKNKRLLFESMGFSCLKDEVWHPLIFPECVEMIKCLR